jgi:hypothetical protein
VRRHPVRRRLRFELDVVHGEVQRDGARVHVILP